MVARRRARRRWRRAARRGSCAARAAHGLGTSSAARLWRPGLRAPRGRAQRRRIGGVSAAGAAGAVAGALRRGTARVSRRARHWAAAAAAATLPRGRAGLRTCEQVLRAQAAQRVAPARVPLVRAQLRARVQVPAPPPPPPHRPLKPSLPHRTRALRNRNSARETAWRLGRGSTRAVAAAAAPRRRTRRSARRSPRPSQSAPPRQESPFGDSECPARGAGRARGLTTNSSPRRRWHCRRSRSRRRQGHRRGRARGAGEARSAHAKLRARVLE